MGDLQVFNRVKRELLASSTAHEAVDKRLLTIQSGVDSGAITHEISHKMNISDICLEVRNLDLKLELVDKRFEEVCALLRDDEFKDFAGFEQLRDHVKDALVHVYNSKLCKRKGAAAREFLIKIGIKPRMVSILMDKYKTPRELVSLWSELPLTIRDLRYHKVLNDFVTRIGNK
eukprot:117917-Amphidinium_carterae.1